MPPRHQDQKLCDMYRMYLDDYSRSLAAVTDPSVGPGTSKCNTSETVPITVRQARRRRKVSYLFYVVW